MKFNEGKPKVRLVYPSAIYEMAKVREYGFNKHGSLNGWMTTPSEDHYDACMRHVLAAAHGEQYDKDSGLKHLSHAMCNLMFLIEEENRKEECTWGESVEYALKEMEEKGATKRYKENENGN
jgi:hypothetical protein